MKWIKLFEEYSPKKSLSTPNIIFLKFFIDSFLKNYKRIDKKNKIEIVKVESTKKDKPSVKVLLFDEDSNSATNSNRYNFISIVELPDEFDKFFISYYGETFYEKLCSYKTEIVINFHISDEHGKYIHKTKLKMPVIRWLLIEQAVKKFLPEYEIDILVNKKNIFPLNLDY